MIDKLCLVAKEGKGVLGMVSDTQKHLVVILYAQKYQVVLETFEFRSVSTIGI